MNKDEKYIKELEQFYIDNGKELSRQAEEMMNAPLIQKQQDIIGKQETVINIYKNLFKFINQQLFSCVKHQRELQQNSDEKYNFELMDFAWATNDCLVDQPELYKLIEELKELK